MIAKANRISFKSRGKWPELVQEAVDWVIRAFMVNGLDKAEAESHALTAIDAITEATGGQMIYMPRMTNARLKERNLRVYEEFTGSNQGELARKHGVSVQHVYRIIQLQREQRRTTVHAEGDGS